MLGLLQGAFAGHVGLTLAVGAGAAMVGGPAIAFALMAMPSVQILAAAAGATIVAVTDWVVNL